MGSLSLELPGARVALGKHGDNSPVVGGVDLGYHRGGIGIQALLLYMGRLAT